MKEVEEGKEGEGEEFHTGAFSTSSPDRLCTTVVVVAVVLWSIYVVIFYSFCSTTCVQKTADTLSCCNHLQ